MNEIIMVSIVCTTYNHEDYIRDCLEGFLSQNTSFKFEVIVHDDSSKDYTAQIIKEYEIKYPDIIKPIFESENMFSKGVKIPQIIYPYIKGKYVATCEGDDFWCDSDKLQKQVDFLESHPDYVACVHNTQLLNCKTGQKKTMYQSNHDKDLELEDVVYSGGAAYHFSSIMRRSEFYLLPDALSVKSFGDYPISIYLELNGKVHYLKEVMSVYRYFSKDSYTSRTSKMSLEQQNNITFKAIDMLQRFDAYSHYAYSEVFQSAIDYSRVRILYRSKDYRSIFVNPKFRKVFYKKEGILKCFILFVRAYCPLLNRRS